MLYEGSGNPNPAVARYLAALRSSLTRMSDDERDRAVHELASYIDNASANGEPVADVLVRLGAPERLALTYLPDEALSRGNGYAAYDAHDDQSRPGRWISIAVLFAVAGLISLVVVPTLFALALGLGIGGLAAVAAGIAAIIWPSLITSPFPLLPGVGQSIAVLVGLVLVGGAWLSWRGLRMYLQFIIKELQRATSNHG